MTANGATEIALTQTGSDAEQASLEWIDRLTKDAGGDDMRLLELIVEHARIAEAHQERLRDERDAAFVRLRNSGVSNIAMTTVTGMSNSGIARRAIKAGAPRRVNRRKGPTDRRAGPPERRLEGSP